MTTLPSLPRTLSDALAEYEEKSAAIGEAVAAFLRAGDALKTAATVAGAWGNVSIETGYVHERQIADSLLKSAWRHVYRGLNIDRLASASDKRRFEQAMASPAPFTIENIRATFGPFLTDPRGNILRGLAEAFSTLDPAFKSHDRVKVGVKGLPKRVILTSVGSYGSWGRDRLTDILNALAAYQGLPLVSHGEIDALLEDGDVMRDGGTVERPRDEPFEVIRRGVWLKRFGNGNGHLFFAPDTLRDVNRALAEYYGEVLPDTAEAFSERAATSTAVSKDLQYYPTPFPVVERVVADLYHLKGARVLEPSCGCGRFMDALRAAGAEVIGVEVDPGRAAMCEERGHRVIRANFLETVPTGDFDRVVMNPPFYGKHYAKHVRHALEFLKPDGVLTAILPVTARYDHGLLEGSWSDLPVGSFAESGTNINTTVLTMRREAELRRAA